MKQDAYLEGIMKGVETPDYMPKQAIMKKYVFSFINFFDNMLTSKVIESTLPILTVAIQEIGGLGWDVEDSDREINNLDDLKCFMFDCDAMFEIIEV